MFPSVTIFVLMVSVVVEILLYLRGHIVKKNAVQTSSAIDVSNYVWARSSTFKRTIIGKALCFFIPGSSFAYPLNVYFNKNYNDPYGYIIGPSLKDTLKS